MSQDYSYIPNLLSQKGEIPAGSILSQTIYGDALLKAILFTFAEGQELSEHTSAQTAVLHSIVAKTPVTMLLLMFKGA
jgi:hypothetical protein